MLRSLLLALASLSLAACTTVPSFVTYDRYGAYASERAGNRTYTEIAPIIVTQRGYLWDSCERLVSRVMAGLETQKALLQGDAIVQVRWHDYRTGRHASIPRCTQEWGWAALFVVGALGPWAQVASAEGVVVSFEKMPDAVTPDPAPRGSSRR